MAPKAKKTAEKTEAVKVKYFEGRGGRKSAVARVRVYAQKGDITVNDRKLDVYFPSPKHRALAVSPLGKMNLSETVFFTAKVYGGGTSSQAEAVRHGLSQALLKFDETLRVQLRKAGFLTRDSREVERKKPGLKKARRAPQWAKR